ncbi:hypothetical protein K470DRAFT_206201, partial [Piedraia hortae CBS 480.64]
YNGCYKEVPGHALRGKSQSSSSMNNQGCAKLCSGYQFFATEYASECYCGNTLDASSAVVNDGRCFMASADDNSVMCGGPNELSLY